MGMATLIPPGARTQTPHKPHAHDTIHPHTHLFFFTANRHIGMWTAIT